MRKFATLFAACGRRGLNFWAGNARAFPAFLYLRKTLGDGREGIPFFQLTGREQYDTLSVDDISVTVITATEERGIHMGTTALTEAVFYILLSLDTPLHGYGIMQNVEHLSGGRVRLAAGTLYGALATLTERGWIVSLGDESEGRKKEYQITPEGREAVRAELRRLHELTQNGDKLTNEWN